MMVFAGASECQKFDEYERQRVNEWEVEQWGVAAVVKLLTPNSQSDMPNRPSVPALLEAFVNRQILATDILPPTTAECTRSKALTETFAWGGCLVRRSPGTAPHGSGPTDARCIWILPLSEK
jgi:hypothetical protein